MVRHTLPIYNVRPNKSQYVKELALLELEQLILPDIACLIADFADDLPPLPWIPPPYTVWSIVQPEYDTQGYYGYLSGTAAWDENNYADDF